MKLAIGFLILGAALAVPQNFFLTFHPKSNFASPGESADHGAFRGPLSYEPNSNRKNFAFLPKSPYGFPFHGGNYFHNSEGVEQSPAVYSSQDDETESRNRAQQRFLFGGPGSGGFFYPFFPSISTSVRILIAYTSTINATMTLAVVSTCIPLVSFSATAATAVACTAAGAAPVGRRKRSLWEDIDEVEDLHPSAVEEVVPTAIEELPSLDRPARDLDIVSSQDEQVPAAMTSNNRQKRFFFGLTPTITLTSILSTVSTSTTFTQVTNTSTLTQYSSYTCLPPGYVVCK